MGHPLLPIDHKTLTRAETADVLRGFAELVEQYPAENFVLSLNLEMAATETVSSPSRKKKKSGSS